MKESEFQRKFIRRVKSMFPDCIVLKNDANYCQGIPDFIVLYKTAWVALEFKASRNATHRPNQDYYIQKMDYMSYAAFVFPESQEEVLDGIQEAFRFER